MATRKRTTVWLDPEDVKALEKISEQSIGKPAVSGLIRDAIKNFIEEHSTKKK